jgi:hypothetical protein
MPILRIALTDHGGKWIPGTVLGVHDDKWEWQWGDKAQYLLIKAGAVSETLAAEIRERKWAVKFKESDGGFLSGDSLNARLHAQSLMNAFHQGGQFAPSKMDVTFATVEPKFDKVVDVTPLFFQTPESQWTKPIEEPKI